LKSSCKQNEGNFGSSPIEPEWEIKTVMLDPRIPDKIVTISQDLTLEEEKNLLSFLDKNNDVFAWKASDLTRVSRDIIEHRLEVNPSARPKKQRLCKMSDEKVAAAKQMFRGCWTHDSYVKSTTQVGSQM
jgi:hypothetical protein